MEFDPTIAGYYTSDADSFAYVSARERWPVILDGAIGDVAQTIDTRDDTQFKGEGKRIIDELQKLSAEIRLDAKLSPITHDGFDDTIAYNQELAQRRPTWLNVCWLYGECYLYRRVYTFFKLSQKWKDYDIFARQKLSTFRSSKVAVLELAARYKTIVGDRTDQSKSSEMLSFKEMCEICLWGNATDLSLLTSLTYEDLQKLQGSEAREQQEKNVLVNDTIPAFDVLYRARREKAEIRVDIVLDNAGFELYVNLLLVGFLLSTGLATNVVLHPKSMPWFVSDATPADFAALMEVLSDPVTLFGMDGDEDGAPAAISLSDDEAENIRFLYTQLSAFHQSGALAIRSDPFWTTAGSYWRLPHAAPGLFNELQKSDLVIFKGDLNYRKLTGDVLFCPYRSALRDTLPGAQLIAYKARWEPTTPFAKAIGPLGIASGIQILALRTCKADVVVGVDDGEDERLRGGNGTAKREWAWTGKWAVVSLCDGKA